MPQDETFWFGDPAKKDFLESKRAEAFGQSFSYGIKPRHGLFS